MLRASGAAVVLLPAITAVFGHASVATSPIPVTAVGVEAGAFLQLGLA